MRIDRYVVTDTENRVRFGPRGFKACDKYKKESVRCGVESGTLRIESEDEYDERMMEYVAKIPIV